MRGDQCNGSLAFSCSSQPCLSTAIIEGHLAGNLLSLLKASVMALLLALLSAVPA